MLLNFQQYKGKEIKKELNDFYVRCDYHGGVDDDDSVFVVRHNDQMIGAVRICYEQKHWVLRGMQISSEFHRKGIGTKLLKSVQQFLSGKECLCLPHDYLESFYAQIGFKKIDPEQAPVFLQKRLRGYLKHYPKLVVMKK